jgi:hypothetical protein
MIRRDDNAEDDNCSRGTAFRRFLETTIGSNETFRVAVRLYSPDMSMLKLNFRRNMTAPNALRYPAGTVAAASDSMPSPPPPPNKVHVNPNMETKRFTAQDIPSLHRRTDIQRWYNVLHSRALICGVYTVPWKAFTKSSHIGDTWSLAFLPQEVMDRQGLMSAALNALLSSQDIFKGNCTTFVHMILNTEGDGYLTLYQLVRLVHPSLGQATAQPQQPIHKPPKILRNTLQTTAITSSPRNARGVSTH